MSGMSGHVIIAGFGRVGELISQMLSERLIPFVALDVSASRVQVRAAAAPLVATCSCCIQCCCVCPECGCLHFGTVQKYVASSPGCSATLPPLPLTARRRARSSTCPCTLVTPAPPPCCTPWAPRTLHARWVPPSRWRHTS